jgi:hypothetical protein
VDYVFSVLTSTLRAGSTRANPHHLVRENIPIDKTLDFFTLDTDILSGDIPIYDDIGQGLYKVDADRDVISFKLTGVEVRRLLAVAIYWDNVCAMTVGTPDVDEWYGLNKLVLGETLRNAIAGKARVPPLPKAPPTAAALAATAAAAASANFEKGTRRSVADYKIFRDRKTWNQFQRGLLATAHMHGVGLMKDGLRMVFLPSRVGFRPPRGGRSVARLPAFRRVSRRKNLPR